VSPFPIQRFAGRNSSHPVFGPIIRPLVDFFYRLGGFPKTTPLSEML
jgi:hypothetical protein